MKYTEKSNDRAHKLNIHQHNEKIIINHMTHTHMYIRRAHFECLIASDSLVYLRRTLLQF